VTNVQFAYDDSYLISCGGNDRTIFQWKCVGSFAHSKDEPEIIEEEEIPEPVRGGPEHSASIPSSTSSEEVEQLRSQLKETVHKLNVAINSKEKAEKAVTAFEAELSELKRKPVSVDRPQKTDPHPESASLPSFKEDFNEIKQKLQANEKATLSSQQLLEEQNKHLSTLIVDLKASFDSQIGELKKAMEAKPAATTTDEAEEKPSPVKPVKNGVPVKPATKPPTKAPVKTAKPPQKEPTKVTSPRKTAIAAPIKTTKDAKVAPK